MTHQRAELATAALPSMQYTEHIYKDITCT